MGFNLIYWSPMCGKYFLEGSILEKCGKIWKNGLFSGRLWPDWGNTAWAAMAGLGSIGLTDKITKSQLALNHFQMALNHKILIFLVIWSAGGGVFHVAPLH